MPVDPIHAAFSHLYAPAAVSYAAWHDAANPTVAVIVYSAASAAARSILSTVAVSREPTADDPVPVTKRTVNHAGATAAVTRCTFPSAASATARSQLSPVAVSR